MKNSLTRVLMLALVLVLVLTTGILSAMATETTVAVSSSTFLTHQGESFTTTIYIPDGANIVDFDITLNYDTDLINLVSVVENEDCKGTVMYNADESGEIAINYTRTSKNVTEYLPLLDLTFAVDDNIGVGAYNCFSVDKSKTYIAHSLNGIGSLDVVDFECSFAPLVIYEMGDVDLNGSVNIGDATYIRRHLAELEGSTLGTFNLTLADTFYDCVVDIADAVCLQRRLARLDVLYGDRVNVTFVNLDGEVVATKSVLYNGTLSNIPFVPAEDGYSGGVWSQSATEYIAPQYSNMTEDVTLYAYYEGGKTSEAVAYYKRRLTDQYFSGDMATNLSSDLNLWSTLYYQNGYYANFIWSSDSNYILNSTTGKFTKPTYPQDLTLTAKIISYDANDSIESEDSISFTYSVPGEFITPSKTEVADWLRHYFTDSTDNQPRVNYDVKLIAKLNNVVIPVEGTTYDNFEIRLTWYQRVEGQEVPVSQIKRTTEVQVNDYVAVATFNGKPLEGDGKIYIDDVEVTAIDQLEIKNHIIQQIAANMGTLATDGIELWNNDTVYGTNVTWETGNSDIAYVANNVVELKDDAVTGSTLPLNARVSYAVDEGTEEFVLSYNLTVSCDNTVIKAPENMDPELYKAIKAELEEELGYRGDLTSAALANVKFVNLDLSGYPEITSLRGLSYCTHLRTLNISGLHITDGTMNQIATLSYLEAFIARGCGLDNLSDGGTATLRNAVNLQMIDLTDNNFTSLDSVFAESVRYGKLREVYLSDNKLTDINALSRAPIVTYLSLSNNGLTTEGTASIANYPYLQYLSLAHNQIDSVEHLTGLKHLVELRLHHNQLTDVRALRTLINLEILYLGHNQIADVGFLSTLTALEVLYVNDNLLHDVSTLDTLTKLEIVNVSNNNLSSLSVLRNYTGTLTEIYAENNRLTDFSFINGATNLRMLMLAGNEAELAQTNMTTWLSALTQMEVLTLSDIQLTDLSFLASMEKLARLDVADCGLSAFTGETSNIAFIADRYATLRILNISDNNMAGYEEEILNLRNLSLLTVLYADNLCDDLDVYTLTYSMPELMYISLENCGIDTMRWLFKYNNLAYVDLAGNDIASVCFESDISNASIKTLEELYLDTNVPCTFTDAYRVADFNVKKLSLAGISVEHMEYLPYMDNITYLNLDGTGITSLIGEDAEMAEYYSVERYATVQTIDVSNLEADISVLENLPQLQTVYAVGAADSELFYEDNLHALQRMYNDGITCYLYDKQTAYEPVASAEGTEILGLLEDISCDVTVAADNVLSVNNPYLAEQINDFDITWSVSNSVNYEIVDNYLAVKDYTHIDDETLTITAQITVYPDQEPVTREFTINTHILRASAEYFAIDATGYSTQLTRDKSFTYALSLKAAENENFAVPVKPVADYIEYSYEAVSESGVSIPYGNVLTVDEETHIYTISSEAPHNATAYIRIVVGHTTADGTKVADASGNSVPVTVAERTFTVTLHLNGAQLLDANGVNWETFDRVEDSLIFQDMTLVKVGYIFDGWYLDEAFDQKFSADGTDATMPSEDLTLYAKWIAHSFNLIFDANGGEVNETSRLVLCDKAVGTMPVPTRTGYTFQGWFTADDVQITETSSMATAEDVTVYAKWAIIPYSVSWNTGTGYLITVERTASPNANAATGTLSSGSEVYHGDVLSVTYEAETGYTLNRQGSENITVTGDVTSATIYAAAKVNSYTLSWNTGTGYSIVVQRTSSPKAGASVGALSNGDTIYYSDTLSVSYVASTGYSITDKGLTSIAVTGDVTSDTVYAAAEVNSYTYNIVYKSSNNTALGSATVTYNYGTTNTITPIAFAGYTTPAAQSVNWDSTEPKTITFTYAPVAVATTQSVTSGVVWNYNGTNALTYAASIEYRNRTATSVQVRVIWTNTIAKGYYYGFAQYFSATVGSTNTGSVLIANASYWAKSNTDTSTVRSKTVSTGWITVSLNTTNQTSVWLSGSWSTGSGASGSWSGSFKVPAY